MQETLFDRSFEMAQSALYQQGSVNESESSTSNSSITSANADLARLFNAAILSTRSDRKRDFAGELYQLIQTPAFEAILTAIRTLSATTGLTEQQAAEQVIRTFRKIDSVWTEYAFQEGFEALTPKS